jgi:hypothetical protein
MRLVLSIEAYDVATVTEHYEDGTFLTFDSITADIVGGARAGERLRILVESNSALANQWNRPGEVVTVSVEPAALASPIVFAGAFVIE